MRNRKKKGIKKNKDLRDLWGIIKYSNMYVMRIPEEQEKMNKMENIWRNKWPKMSPNLITNIILHIQKPKQTPGMMNLKRSTSRYITNCQKAKRKRKIKTFSDKQKLEEFVASVPILQDILMGPPD